ncbi:hypothetical protein GE061_020331 [Apolygus lucorum]|uniref:Uncharacterized protein n=1 Tax=Apolygus lucorum TaxID=248454 RepID=A0A8S9WJC3_APOLU|nr:hypothetical protein GE061_020331 [Apolygus lucorum]
MTNDVGSDIPFYMNRLNIKEAADDQRNRLLITQNQSPPHKLYHELIVDTLWVAKDRYFRVSSDIPHPRFRSSYVEVLRRNKEIEDFSNRRTLTKRKLTDLPFHGCPPFPLEDSSKKTRKKFS